MKKELKVFTILILFLFINISSFGQLLINAYVATFSPTTLDYSDYFFRKVTIIPGLSLKVKTKDPNYDSNADYILLRFSQTEVAIIKLKDNLLDFGQRLDFDSMDESFFRIALMSKKKTWEGYDQDKSKWRICFGSEYDKYSCETKKDDLFFLIDGSNVLAKLIEDYNRILEFSKSSTASNCESNKNLLNSIESNAKDLKDRFESDSFRGNDPYWETYIEFIKSCTEVENKSNELSKSLCNQ